VKQPALIWFSIYSKKWYCVHQTEPKIYGIGLTALKAYKDWSRLIMATGVKEVDLPSHEIVDSEPDFAK